MDTREGGCNIIIRTPVRPTIPADYESRRGDCNGGKGVLDIHLAFVLSKC